MQTTRIILFALFALLILSLIVLFPLTLIWAVNTLFLTTIEYNITNWLASLILIVLFGNQSSPKLQYKKEEKTCCRK
jgi:hypothetical protein